MPERLAPIAKISRPRIRGVFPRERLFGLLDETRKYPLTWISAPAGSGKTTLVASYLEANKIPCLWYQVDEGDADIATFFSYLGLAAQKAAPLKRKPLPLLTPEYLQGIPTFTLRFFENLFSRLRPPFILVLDNYQTVPIESNFHEVINVGINAIPDGINVIVVSRHDPPPVLARLRANEMMKMLGWGDLCLTLEETKGIVPLKAREIPSKEVIKQLHQTADGWVAGLVLMLEGMKRGVDPHLLGKMAPKEIFDYFGNEFFNKTDQEMQAFLLQTAFLPKVTIKAAKQLSGLSNANRILSTLNRNNYFTERHFFSEPVYQYHPLLREFLMARAKETFSHEALSTLLHQAAILLEQDGQIEAAISLFRDLNDWVEMVQLILKQAPSMVEQGRNRPLEEWLSSLPKGMMENDPWLPYWMGICRLPFDPVQSRPYFEKAFEKFHSQGETTGIFLSIWGIVYSIIYGMADYTLLDRWIPELEKFGQNFKEFPSDEIELQFNSAMFSALAYRQPQHPEIETWAENALSLAENSSNLSLKLQTISSVAIYRLQMGDFGKALLVINSIRKLSQSRDATPFIRIHLETIEALYYRFVGSYEKCLKAVTDGLELSRTTGIHMYEIALLYHGMSSAVSASDQATAARLLEEMAPSLKSFRTFDLCTYHSAKTQESLFRGDLNQALIHVELATKLRIESGYTILKGWCHIQNAQVMHELGRHREAAEHLTHAFDFAREVKGNSTEYGALLAGALFAFDQGKEEAGLFSLREAFALGRERGYFGTYGPPPSGMTKLCTKALEAGVEVEYVQELIRRLHVIPNQPPLHLENWPWPFKIYTLGQFRLEKDGNPIQFSRKVQQKPLSLLKTLIAFGGRGVQETKIADVLWPEADGDDAHHSFVTNLHRLRQLIGQENAIHLKDGKLTLDDKYCWVDVFAFEQTLRQAEDKQKNGLTENIIQLIENAIDLYRGSFLTGEIEQPWMISLRERLRSKFLWGVTRLGRCWRETEQWEKAIRCYQRGLEIDDMAEELYQLLMTCYQRLGQRNEALSVYNRLKRTLSAVLGVEPSSKTEAIYRSLMP